MNKIQKQFNSLSGGDFILSPDEYEGPLVVSRSCTIDGNGSTLWADAGPVLLVSAPDVVIKNLRVEMVGNSQEKEAHTAVRTDAPDTRLENVEVNGDVVGFPDEAERWELPKVVTLGRFASGKTNNFYLNIDAPKDAVIESNIKDLKIYPNRLSAGNNRLMLTVGELRNGTVLYGEIMVRTLVSRRIYVTGQAMPDAPVYDESSLPKACPWFRPMTL